MREAALHSDRNLTLLVGFLGTGVVSVSPQVHNWAPTQGHTASSVWSGAKAPNPAECSSDHKPKQQVAAQNSLSLPFPTATIPLPQGKPKYCCTLCGYVRLFKNQSDWKKHEREHDTTYFCMLKGPREATPQGAQCSFCGILNPDGEHLLKHNAQACLEGMPKSFSCKRRRDMVNHLGKIHNINLKSRGEAIAEKWKYTIEKRAWSCGFCVKVFFTFHDRLSHIASQHFERGQTIEEWDNTKVIQGLLQQSSMIKAWKDKMASLPTWEVRDIIWVRDAIKELQYDLEVGPNDEKSAVDLAEAAYITCRLNWGMGTQQASAVSRTKSEEAFVATSFLPIQSQAPLISAPESGSNHHQSLSAGQEVSEASPSGPATQTIVDYDYSSASLFDLNDSENIGLVSSPFFSQ